MAARAPRKLTASEWLLKFVLITIGAVLMGIALELFLVPNTVLDGGVAGVSIIVSKLAKLPLGIFIFLINLPFLFLGYRQLGKVFVVATLYGITVMSLTTGYLHNSVPFTDDNLLAVLFGGLILGLGVGLVIRSGGALDGSEIVAILLSNKFNMSVGQIVMFINVFVFAAAGFVFGWDSAMYSVFAYFIAFKTIDIVVEGLDESKSVTIISKEYEEIAEAITERLGRTSTFLSGMGSFHRQEIQVIYCVITRLELSRLKSIVQEIDPKAFISIENVADVIGGGFDKNKAH